MRVSRRKTAAKITIVEPIHDWEDFDTELEIGCSNFLNTQRIFRLRLDPLLSHFALPAIFFIVGRQPLMSSEIEVASNRGWT